MFVVVIVAKTFYFCCFRTWFMRVLAVDAVMIGSVVMGGERMRRKKTVLTICVVIF